MHAQIHQLLHRESLPDPAHDELRKGMSTQQAATATDDDEQSNVDHGGTQAQRNHGHQKPGQAARFQQVH